MQAALQGHDPIMRLVEIEHPLFEVHPFGFGQAAEIVSGRAAAVIQADGERFDQAHPLLRRMELHRVDRHIDHTHAAVNIRFADGDNLSRIWGGAAVNGFIAVEIGASPGAGDDHRRQQGGGAEFPLAENVVLHLDRRAGGQGDPVYRIGNQRRACLRPHPAVRVIDPHIIL